MHGRRPFAALVLLATTGCLETFSLRDAGVDPCLAHDGGIACACDTGLTRCGDACVSTRTSVAHCGACGRACPATQSCVDGQCGCATGQHLFAGACIPDAPPRALAPVSLGDVTQRRPTLRWALPAGFDGAVVELCRDRACAMPLETLTVTGRSARPTSDLPPRSVVFWRMRAQVGTTIDTVYSPTWLFHVPARSAPGAVDTSFNPHLDVNADGFDDVVVGAQNIGRAFVYLGGGDKEPLRGAPVVLAGPDGSAFGGQVANAGDVDGDGYADVVVGAPLASPGGRFQTGTASVFLGGASGVTTTAATVFEGVGPDDRLGAVASAGDLNADGYADVVVGAYRASPRGRVYAGTARVFLGGGTGLSTTAATVIEGVAEGDSLGSGVASAGDVNGDGYGDLVVGAMHASPSRNGWAGTASVFLGGASGLAETAAVVLEGPTENGLSGTVACAGDVNGDGYADLVVGAPEGATGSVRTGTARVFHGSASGVATTAARVLAGVGAGDYFGASAASAGDVNGDGYDDLVVGALVASPGGRFQAGTAHVFLGSASGVAATAARVLEGPVALERFSSGLAGAGDLDGDGYDDVVVGAYLASPDGRHQAGTASVFLGTPSGIPSAAAQVISGAETNNGFGTSVACWRFPRSVTLPRRSDRRGGRV